MKLNRLGRKLGPIALILLGVAGVVTLVMILATILLPGLTEGVGLGLMTLGETLTDQAAAVQALTGLSPLADILLFVAAYVFVCVALWIQGELRNYFANRSHFE